MRSLEICLWAMAVWCGFFGFRATLGLTNMWKDRKKHHWVTPVAFLALGLMQFAGLTFFISSALWTHTLQAAT